MATQFQISAMDADKKIVRLKLEAASIDDARALASSRGLRVLGIRQVSLAPKVASKRGGAKFDLLLFAQELAALIEAGLSLTESIETLAEKETRSHVKSVLDSVRDALYQGQSLSQALAAKPDIFPELLVASVRASETTGDLDKALGRYIAYQQQIEALQKRLISAAMYPAMLLVAGGGVCMFLLGYLVPKFSRIYDGMHGELPFLSRMLLGFGGAIEKHRSLAIAMLIAGVGGLIMLLKQPASRAVIANWAWRSPGLGERLKLFQLARFYRASGMLLQAGIPLVTAFERVAELLHPALRTPLIGAVGALRQGQPVAETLERAGLTTPVALRLLRVGEKSGRLGEMMERIAAFYDEELGRFVDAATKLVEPILMLLMGGFIGLIVVLMYLPIFELAGGLK
ncbi:type II secretion system F family protein [Parachitinimonas caeni]|uniref:Type II secretion system F family protein n=1 Tax=Parachitinimonas caeni TaxID=3031301 RepID=A0ABT7E2H7_9NEIS|nr:type II secretion system F family protein [Parachitinimonas caeni]MDK2126449.1 type II secretion system F family protein [Parachitinimonas caeni]